MITAPAAAHWHQVFRDLPREHGFEDLRIEGQVPDDLAGALYRCGPARFTSGDGPYRHWFDGDGAVTAVRIGKGRAAGATRLVQTRWLRRERAAGRQLYRSYAQLGVGWRRWLTLPKNPANVSVMPWAGQLLALWEAGLPIALDPRTLETVGETTLGGRIGPTFSAHPHRVGNAQYNFGVRYGARFALDLYELGAPIRRLARIPLPRPTIIHDFIATRRHLVFFCPPIRLRLGALITGRGSFCDNLVWEPQHGTEIIVVPLSNPQEPVRFTVPAFFQWHFVNAWEEGDIVVADHLPYDDFTTNQWFGQVPFSAPSAPPASRYARARIDLAARSMRVETLSTRSCEFPALHPAQAGQPHTAAWFLSYPSAGDKASQPPGLCRFSPATGALQTVPLGAQDLPSEPQVVPRAGHDDGWVLSLVYDGERQASHVAVIDGAHPERGAVAKLWFDHGIPFPFHGSWDSTPP